MQIILSHSFTQSLPKEQILSQGSEKAAGYDLFLCQKVSPAGIFEDFENFSLFPNQAQKFTTGLRIFIEDRFIVGKIYPRSGKGSLGIVLGNLTGIIDADYTGEIILSIWNRSEDAVTLTRGEKVAQILFESVYHPDFEFVSEFSAATKRGQGGYGSSGSGVYDRIK